jgi:hypothetical protein
MNIGSKGNISIMKKFYAIAVIIIQLWIMPYYAYAVTVTDVMAWGAGAWQGTTRVIPSLVRISGGAAAGSFYRIAFGWPGVAAMALCAAGSYMYAHRNDTGTLGDAIRSLLAQIGYRATADGVEKGTTAGEGSLTPNAAALAVITAKIAANGYTPSKAIWFSTYSLAIAAWGNSPYFENSTHTYYYAGNWSSGAAGYGEIVRHSGAAGHAHTFPGIDQLWFGYVYFCYPNTGSGGAVTAETTWVSKTAAQMQTDAGTALADGTITDAEKNLWANLEPIFANALRTNDTSILGLSNGAGKTLDQVINEQSEAAINTDSTLAEESTGVIEAINNLTNRIGDLITGAVTSMTTAIQNALGLSDTVADQTNTGIDVNENDTVIDSATIAGELNAQKAVTTGYLDSLFDSITGLADRMKTKVESMVNAGSGVCSLSFSVYGQNQSLDFCSIDFSAIRAALLFVATIAAVMIILL